MKIIFAILFVALSAGAMAQTQVGLQAQPDVSIYDVSKDNNVADSLKTYRKVTSVTKTDTTVETIVPANINRNIRNYQNMVKQYQAKIDAAQAKLDAINTAKQSGGIIAKPKQ